MFKGMQKGIGGASVETAGVRRLEFVEGPTDTAGSTQVAYNIRTCPAYKDKYRRDDRREQRTAGREHL